MKSFKNFLREQEDGQPKVLHIMRGVTGMGKSELAKKMNREFIQSGFSSSIHTPDSFFMTPPTEEHPEGTYQFDPSKLREAHARNLDATVNSMSQGTDHVFVDATNLVLSHMAPYVRAAMQQGYRVNFIDMNEHPGAPSREELEQRHVERGERIPGFDLRHIIDRMEQTYQPFKTESNEDRMQEVLAAEQQAGQRR